MGITTDWRKDPSIRQFVELAQLPESEVPLFRTALMIGAIQAKSAPFGWWIEWEEQLQELVQDARFTLLHRGKPTDYDRALSLCRWFSLRLGFRGDRDDYNAPENSCLHHVMKRRRGLPITLSVLLICIARQLDLDFFGAAGAFRYVVGVRTSLGVFYYDPFVASGELQSEQELLLSLIEGHVMPQELVQAGIQAYSIRNTLVRILNNMKSSYADRGELERLIGVMTWLIELNPDNPLERLNRGLLLLRTGESAQGARDLLLFMQATDDADIRARVGLEIERALTSRALLN
jgi:regulator of sirC expression with transglutaminase-like and TPR domain